MWWLELFLLFMVLICSIMTLLSVISKSIRAIYLAQLARSYLPVFLLVFVVRSFIFQPFKVVSGSLEPTVLIGDFIGVNQSAYGIRLPLIHKKIINTTEPKLGDIALFYYPVDETKVFVKRVIGVPGDHVVYKDKQLIINGKKMIQIDDGVGFDEEPDQAARLMHKKIENLNGIKHNIFVDDKRVDIDVDVTVPPNKYFMMGDNRDDSGDSRYWGFVDDRLLIGRAFRTLVSWDTEKMRVRTSRFGQKFYL